jgi:hypothetical protein
MANTDRGVDLATEITLTLNRIILETGEAIDINNHTIWGEYLHRYTNQDWEDMLSAMEGLHEHLPGMFKPYHEHALLEARMTLDKHSLAQSRVLDHKDHKRKAWKMIMAMRELINDFNGVRIDNKAQPAKPRMESKFHDLFEQ